MKKPGLWRALESLADGAVKTEWALELGTEFERSRHFLRPTQDEAKTYPCTHRFRCECEQHRVEPARNGQRVAVCDCGECEPIRLTPADVTVFEPDVARLAVAVTQACGWRGARVEMVVPGVWRLGTWDELRAPVFWCGGTREERTRAMVDALFTIVSSPFILAWPTRASGSARIDTALQREGCLALPLEDFLALDDKGALRLVKPLDSAREEFLERAVTRRDAAKALRAIQEKIIPANGEQRPLQAKQAGAPALYRLRKGHGVWSLVFDGMEGVIEDCRAMTLLNHLLKHPRDEAMHAVELEAVVAGHGAGDADREAVVQEGSGGRLNAGSNTILKQKLRELKEAIDDDTLPESERDKAQAEFDELLRAAGRGGKMADAATRAAERVGKALKRLQRDLAGAETKPGEPNIVLRAFGEHVRKHVLVPSLRYAGLRGKRSAGRKAGSFIYERPPDVTWAD